MFVIFAIKYDLFVKKLSTECFHCISLRKFAYSIANCECLEQSGSCNETKIKKKNNNKLDKCILKMWFFLSIRWKFGYSFEILPIESI